MASYPDQVRAAERAAIRERYRGRSKPGIAALRVAELNREFSDRYGSTLLPDDDSARDDIEIMLHHLARRSDPERKIPQWLDSRAPWFTGGERDAMVNKVLANPLRFKADTIAQKIGLTAERRARLRIRTIGAVDQSAIERVEARRIAKREYKRALRKAQRDQRQRADPV